MKALLALEDGRTFACRSFTGPGETGGEIVFNTAMTGYQEVLTDPSYRGQMVTMTYPLIGNYGINGEDVESDGVQVAAFLMREYEDRPSNYRASGSLADYLRRAGVLGVDALDTRAVTRHIRTAGAMRAFVSTHVLDADLAVRRARQLPTMEGQDLARVVTTDRAYLWESGRARPLATGPGSDVPPPWRHRGRRPAVLAFDFGIKYNILRCLEAQGFEILVVPARTGADVVRSLKPDGIFLSNGPGDPEPVNYAIATIRDLLGYRPILGICLGHQLLGLALGGRTYKLKFGHRGANQPVKNLLNGRIEITSQNHGFAVNAESLADRDVEITHLNLNDHTLEGFRQRELGVLAVQYHPEAAPGPHDARYMFGEFRDLTRTTNG